MGRFDLGRFAPWAVLVVSPTTRDLYQNAAQIFLSNIPALLFLRLVTLRQHRRQLNAGLFTNDMLLVYFWPFVSEQD